MNNRLYFALLGIVMTSLLSCQKNEVFDTLDTDDSNKIGFSLLDSHISTRGTAREGDGLSVYNTDKVNVFVYSYDESKSWSEVSSSSDYTFYFRSKLNDLNNNLSSPNWGYASDEPQTRFYPQTKRISCFAYASDLAPITATPNENGFSISDPSVGVPTITYTIPTDVSKQPDLIVSERVTDRGSGKITLPMKHALTRIGISMLGKGQKISDVSITGVAGQGSLSVDVNGAIDWDLTGAAYDEEYKFGLIKSYIIFSEEPFNPLRSDGYLMMLPQQMTEDVKLNFLLNDKPVSVSLNASSFPDWEPGKKITYLIDVTSKEPVITVDFGGSVLSNCYIITPSLTSKQELKIPVNRVNQFWGDSQYDSSSDGYKNIIGADDRWSVSILWYDAFDLVSLPGGQGVQLGKSTGTGVNDYFSVIVPAGFKLKGNLLVGIAKGDTPPVLVKGGTVDSGGGIEPGAGAKCLWSWHIWITDYDPYPEYLHIQSGDNNSGKYAQVPGGYLWQAVPSPLVPNFYQINNVWITGTLGLYKSTGDDVWVGNNRMLLDRPIGVRSKEFMCEDISNYIGTATEAVGYESGANQATTRLNGNGVLYYQFGRKDPLPADIKLYTIKNGLVNQPVEYSPTGNGEDAPVSVWYTVYNPLRMIHTGLSVDPYSGGGNWSSDEYARSDYGNEDILWADPRTKEHPTAKSLFDPSPWLFRTPRTGTYNSFITNYRYYQGSTVSVNLNGSPDPESVIRSNMKDPAYMEYMLTSGVKIRFWSWGSRFWKTGTWNDELGFNGQYWMSATVTKQNEPNPSTINLDGWDYYMLLSPAEEYPETNPAQPSPLSGQSTAVRMNPLSPGIRASTMPLIPIQNQLPRDPGVSLNPWNYENW